DVAALQDQHVTASGVPATAAAPAPADDQKLAVKAHGLEASLYGLAVFLLVLGVGVQIELHTTPIPIRDPGVMNSTVSRPESLISAHSLGTSTGLPWTFSACPVPTISWNAMIGAMFRYSCQSFDTPA